MKFYIDIAASYYSESLTIIIGTGFSKWITNGKAPNWVELLIYCADRIDPSLKSILFIDNGAGKFVEGEIPLTIIAQLLEIEAQRKNIEIRDLVKECIINATVDSNIDKDKVELFKSMFIDDKHLTVITTNYDKILSEYIFNGSCRVYVEGSSFSKLSSGVDIFHIHGHINNLKSIILTQSDYYNFQLSDNYFSRKLYTLIHENTIMVLGYSLNDSDVNFIINEANGNKYKNYHNSDIFYITKNAVNEKIIEFYKYTYDIEVLQNTQIENCIQRFNIKKVEAKRLINSFTSFQDVIDGKAEFNDDYLQLRGSFSEILKHLSMTGVSMESEHISRLIIMVLEKKKSFCAIPDAWVQYDHLSDWIIDLLSIVDADMLMNKAELEKLIEYSIETCSSKKYYGLSWDAYNNWDNKWKNMLYKNQILVKSIIEAKYISEDIYGRRLLAKKCD